MNINLMRNTPTIGATLALDLASALRAGGAAKHDAIEQVYAALIEHLVVFIEDVDLTPAEHIDLRYSLGRWMCRTRCTKPCKAAQKLSSLKTTVIARPIPTIGIPI